MPWAVTNSMTLQKPVASAGSAADEIDRLEDKVDGQRDRIATLVEDVHEIKESLVTKVEMAEFESRVGAL